MRPSTSAATSAILIALFAACGCDELTGRQSAPDDSPRTQRDIDAVNADAHAKKQEVDQTYRDQSLGIAFRQNLIKEKAAQQEAQADLDRDKVVQPLKLTLTSTRAQEKADKQTLELDTAQKLKAQGAQPVEIQADHAKRLADIERRASESTAAITTQIEQADATAAKQHAAIAKERDSRLLDTSMELEADERSARQKKADIERATIAKLDAIGANSNERTAQERAASQRSRDADLKITQTIRGEVAKDKSLSSTSKDVEVTTAKGVVQVSGTVPNEAERQTIIALASKVDGVVRVDSLIAVR